MMGLVLILNVIMNMTPSKKSSNLGEEPRKRVDNPDLILSPKKTDSHLDQEEQLPQRTQMMIGEEEPWFKTICLE